MVTQESGAKTSAMSKGTSTSLFDDCDAGGSDLTRTRRRGSIYHGPRFARAIVRLQTT